MKNNLPVTNHEVVMEDGKTIISTTNLKGIITSVNEYFIDISGFTEQELIGKNHNIIRHPDMPPAAFEDLWEHMKASRPWTGLVKNRCKNGDYYWVRADVTPVRENGRVASYMSVRSKPGRDEITQAEALYQKINSGQVSLKPTGIAAWLSKARAALTIRNQMILNIAVLTAVVIFMGVFSLNTAKKLEGFTEKLYQHPFAVSTAVLKVDGDIARIRHTMQAVLQNGDSTGLDAAVAEITQQRKDVLENFKLVEERFLGDKTKVLEARQLFSDWSVMNDEVIQDMRSGQRTAAAELASGKEAQQIQRLDESVRYLVDFAFNKADVFMKGAHENGKSALNAILVMTLAGTALAMVLGFFGVTGVVRPLRRLVELFMQLQEDALNTNVDISRADEIGDVQRAFKCIQIKLGFDILEGRNLAMRSQRIKVALDNVSTNVMMADNDGNIIYLNQSIMEMMGDAEADIREVLPDFSAEKLLGTNIDGFHKNPAHQRDILARLTSTHRARIAVGTRSFDLVANPVVDEKGERLGTAVEWLDVTQQLNAEQQVERLIAGAVKGDLDVRMDVQAYTGFMRTLSEGVNQLMAAVMAPTQEVKRVLTALAEGDLTQTMSGEFQGEFAGLRDAVNSTMGKLSGMVNEIGTSSGAIATAANEISQGTADLSQRSEEQASSLEETASSMEELTGTVRQNADNASQATQLAGSARTEASKGGEVVSKVIDAMAEINTSSKKIADIIGVIDEIAFQTNLLALNAAVEAARAGEQGRGFAVVAGEVRNLAQRSATAAKEIKELINESVEKVDEGSKLVDASGSSLDEIVAGVKKVSDIIAEIAAASQEQASGIDQINKAVTQMDEMTQQNAALVEQTAAASESMNDQAAALDKLMGFFNVGGNTRQAAVPMQRKVAEAEIEEPPVPAQRPVPQKVTDDSEWEEF